MSKLETEVNKLFIKQKKTAAVAESCTGGLLSNLITNIPGSSRYFILGVITYSNASKTSVLKIPRQVILKQGAVSAGVATLMAKSVRRLAKADFAIGITGIAGPSGGSKNKPVGTVFIAVESVHKKICKRFYFKGRRLTIKRKAAFAAMELLKTCLTKN